MLKRFTTLFTLLLLSIPFTSNASETTKNCNSGVEDIECKVSRTTYNSSSWNHDTDMYYFRSTNGRSCNVKAHLKSNTNAKLVFSHTGVLSNGQWGSSGLRVKQDDKKKDWKYNIRWNITCKNRDNHNLSNNTNGISKTKEKIEISTIGNWILKYNNVTKNKKIRVIFKDDNRAIYHSIEDGQNYPAKWTEKNNRIKLKVYGSTYFMNKNEPAIILYITKDGRTLTGTQNTVFGKKIKYTFNGYKE